MKQTSSNTESLVAGDKVSTKTLMVVSGMIRVSGVSCHRMDPAEENSRKEAQMVTCRRGMNFDYSINGHYYKGCIG